MAQSRKRIQFNINGPFIARRAKPVGVVDLELGKVYAASLFADLHPRRLQALFDARWFDMAPEDYDGHIIDTAGNPLDRDGDGKMGGDLSDAEIDALINYGLTHEDWCKLAEGEREETLQAAVEAAANPIAAGDVVIATDMEQAIMGLHVTVAERLAGGMAHITWTIDDEPREAVVALAALVAAPQEPQDAQEAPEGGEVAENTETTAGEASEAASEAIDTEQADLGGGTAPAGDAEAGAAGAVEGEAATAPAVGPLAAYRHEGFGKWYGIDAEGNLLTEAMNKGEAAGLAAQAGLPVLGQGKAVPTQE